MRSSIFKYAFAATALLALLPLAAALAQDDPVQDTRDQIEQACIITGTCGQTPGARAPVMVPLYFAAIAFSASTGNSGSSNGQPSQAAAQQTALHNCGTLATDCKLLNWASNECLGLAVGQGGAYGQAPSGTREGAQAAALKNCQANGKNCVIRATPCAGDDVRFTSPLPLPVAGPNPPTPMDKALVGTWHLAINPGFWVMRLAANGTYTVYSQAMDNTPSNSGTFTADGSHWSLNAGNMVYSDSGDYHIDAQGDFVATGSHGTGTWVRAGS